MLKYLFVIGTVCLLLIGGCGLPTLKNPFKYPYRIVPECSGRVTDLHGNPLPGVRVRIISYGKTTSAISDADGKFTLGPLFAWLGFQDDLNMYDFHFKNRSDNESIAGKRHILFGELSLFFETPTEHFLLSGVNFFPSKYKNFREAHIASSYVEYMFCLCIPDWRKGTAELPVLSSERIDFWNSRGIFTAWDYYKTCRTERLPPNPWDYLTYTLYKRIKWEEYASKRQIRALQTIVVFDDSFVQWLKSKAVSKEMCEAAAKRLADPQIQAGMGVFQISTPVQ